MLPDGCTPRAERQVGAEGVLRFCFFNFYCHVYFEHNVTLSFSVSLLGEGFFALHVHKQQGNSQANILKASFFLTFVPFTFFTLVFFLEIFFVTTTVFFFFLTQKHCIKHHST